jgi:hypothetical protein
MPAVFSALVLTIVFLAYELSTLNAQAWQSLSQEGQFLEWGSALAFAGASLLAFIAFIRKTDSLRLYFSLAMAFAAMRELDWHKAFTSDSILKSNFYESSTTPLAEKIIGGFIILTLIFLLYQFIKRIPLLIKLVWNFYMQAWVIASALGLLVTAKLIDSMARWLPFLADFKTDNGAYLGLVEETLELTAASLFLLLAIRLVQR